MSPTTRKIETDAESPASFLDGHCVTLIVLVGPNAGTEYPLDRAQLAIGRAQDAPVQLNDDAISALHAALELTAEGFRLRDLASTNGTKLNGEVVQTADLSHGDRIELGEHVLQYLVEVRKAEPPTYALEAETQP